VTGNYVLGSRGVGIEAGQGSTVIGNNASNQSFIDSLGGIVVSCPSNVTDNTVTGQLGAASITLIGNGCNNTNNVVAP
jgi:hypothetical protein